MYIERVHHTPEVLLSRICHGQVRSGLCCAVSLGLQFDRIRLNE